MDVFRDKSWVKWKRTNEEYKVALKAFLDHAFETSDTDEKVACPCKNCCNRYFYDRVTVTKHLTIKPMDADYQKRVWIFHGEPREEFDDDNEVMVDENFDDNENLSEDEMIGMVGDAFEHYNPSSSSGPNNPSSSSGPNAEADNFFKLIEDARQPLYNGCEEFSKLSFIVEMYHLKCMYGITNVAFDALVKLFKRALPKDSVLPDSFKKMQNIIKKLDLGYEKIDSCVNDCMLFRKEDAKRDECRECYALRWKTNDDGTIIRLANGDRVPRKVLRHFPLIPRLKRLYMSSKTAHLMRWHEEERIKDGKLRHPADSHAWSDFDYKYPEFAGDSRNVRLGLSSDGFNPFGIMGTQYSVWPVVLMTYNLPPWLCMKQPYFILSLLIPGPKGPGNNIDIYLQPLIEELQELWDLGVETYDASKNETFMLRGALMWTINDFPAYGNLSGWKTKGKNACPKCNVETSSTYLKSSRKLCYMGHRRFLEENHRFRRNKNAFNGQIETASAPRSWSGAELLEQMEELNIKFVMDEDSDEHNKKKKGNNRMPWKKKSIFFKLPYWSQLMLRHNLDVMHVEKNVSENVIGTLLGLEGKTKDTLQSRLDLMDLNIRLNLHPVEDRGRTYLPPACFTLSKKEKEEVLKVLASIKVPDGYASNINRRVVDGKLYGLKSHDHHIMMQQLLPIALRKMQNKSVSTILIELSSFFKELCSKNATPQDFENLQDRIIMTLCHLERIFPPSFFDVMVHVVIHLAEEAKVAGPVFYRWMYPIERYLRKLKTYVRNKSRVEASIAEEYIAEECLTFCSRYLHGVETRENRPARNNDDDGDEIHEGLSIFSLKCRAMSKKSDLRSDSSIIEQAHSYVLANCDEVQVYVQEHYDLLSQDFQGTSESIDQIHRNTFPSWFAANVSRHLPIDNSIADDLRILSLQPSMWMKTMTKITCNGFRWRVKKSDKRSVTQNSGVVVDANTSEGHIVYYGILTEIIELNYQQGRNVVLFRCDWVDPIKGVKKDELGFTLVNLKATLKTNEPFILASQALQVFYTADSKEKNWHVATITKPRDLFEMEEEIIPEVERSQGDLSFHSHVEELNIVREDVVGVTLDESFVNLVETENANMEVQSERSESDEEDDTLYDHDSE